MFLQKIAALLYGMVIRVRNMLFDKDILKGVQYDIPIVCIGNITAGGTGKTPMVELMIAHFSKTHSVAVLSRGYKRKTKGYKVVDAFDSYIDVGDDWQTQPRETKLVFIGKNLNENEIKANLNKCIF